MYQVKAWIADGGLTEGNETVLTPLPLYHIFSFVVNCLCMGNFGANNVLVINAIGSDVFDEDYTLYVCRNIISINGDRLEIDRISLKEASENDRLVLVINFYRFYMYSMNLKSNSNVKKTILRNMKKFATLQSKSYDNFLINLQTLIFSI
jgi:acyl-CoA synthetase (AMP-forming)/AMP-acid ligase II